MEYLYSKNDNYEDYASGRVIYGGKGIPNFPVRLLNEMFQRGITYLDGHDDLVVYDPCCGGGYSLTVLGFFHSNKIKLLCGSDIDENMVWHAKKNVSLLSTEGLNSRKAELETLYDNFGKPSHKDALSSIEVLKKQLIRPVKANIFVADCTKELPKLCPNLIITDVPYGNLVEWNDTTTLSLDRMLEQLAKTSDQKIILVLSMDKKQKVNTNSWTRLEKHVIGKRKFEIMVNV